MIRSKRLLYLSLLAAPVLTFGISSAEGKRRPPTEFEVATIVVEQNATDADTEIVIEVLGGDEGLKLLRIRTPDGWRVLQLSSLDPTVMGIREFAFESPESEGEAILAGYPEGRYTLCGVSVSGERFKSTAQLSHQLPEATVISNPAEDSVVGTDALMIEWSAVLGVAEYVIEFENESMDPEQVLTVNVPADTTSFEVPPGLLTPGSDYQVGVATVGENGNVAVVETTFSTAG